MPNFSFNFNFFLHGDNKVCASVDVQRHRYIYNLTNKDLDKTSPLNGKKKKFFSKKIFFLEIFLVILAPYGINGMLIGHVSRDIDMNILRENWERNYPVRHIDGLPDFIEVTAGRFEFDFVMIDQYSNFFLFLKGIFECFIQHVMYIKLHQLMTPLQVMKLLRQIKNLIYLQLKNLKFHHQQISNQQ